MTSRMMDANHRSQYRLKFPHVERPQMTIGGADYEVQDISTDAARVAVSGLDETAVHEGLITFCDGSECAVRGRVVRADSRSTVLLLEAPGISAVDLQRWQRDLLRRFPRTLGSS